MTLSPDISRDIMTSLCDTFFCGVLSVGYADYDFFTTRCPPSLYDPAL